MTASIGAHSANILLVVEDNEADVRLIRESLRDVSAVGGIHVVQDGEQALAFLRRQGKYVDAPRPALILLDLNLPRKCGREVLADIRADPDIRLIPVAVLSSSEAKEDICGAYGAGANCYVTKALDLDEFMSKAQALIRFWLETVRLPEN